MKRTTVLSIILLIAFFMPWADFNFLSFSGFDLPKSITQLGRMRFLFSESDADFLMLTYLIYLIPLFSIVGISSDFTNTNLAAYVKKVDYYVALIFCALILILLGKMGEKSLSFLGIGFYLTFIIAVVGVFIKDKSIVLVSQNNESLTNDDYTKQLTILKDLLDKELITTEEYLLKKEAILRKMES
jgi:hypothetical protein